MGKGRGDTSPASETGTMGERKERQREKGRGEKGEGTTSVYADIQQKLLA